MLGDRGLFTDRDTPRLLSIYGPVGYLFSELIVAGGPSYFSGLSFPRSGLRSVGDHKTGRLDIYIFLNLIVDLSIDREGDPHPSCEDTVKHGGVESVTP